MKAIDGLYDYWRYLSDIPANFKAALYDQTNMQLQ